MIDTETLAGISNATEGQYRGNKYKQGAILLDAMLRDVEAIGVEVKT